MVRRNDCHAMTIVVDLGRKPTKQTNKHPNSTKKIIPFTGHACRRDKLSAMVTKQTVKILTGRNMSG